MPKLSYLLLITATIFTACSKSGSDASQPQLKLSTPNTEIKYDGSTQLNVNIGSASDYTWTSSDEFIGTVDATGKFTAKHIGGVSIRAEKEGKSANQEITVLPTVDFITEPFIEFGASKAAIKAKEKRELLIDEDGGLAYKATSEAIRTGIFYLFDENDKMVAALIPFTESANYAKYVAIFYAERYQILGQDGTQFYFGEKDKKYALILDTQNDNIGFSAIYLPYPDIDKSASTLSNHISSIQKRLSALQKASL